MAQFLSQRYVALLRHLTLHLILFRKLHLVWKTFHFWIFMVAAAEIVMRRVTYQVQRAGK